MFIQGDLQAVFDALYTVGAIDPVLKLDWQKISHEMIIEHKKMNEVVGAINACGSDQNLLIKKLHCLDEKSLNYLAVEVAREFAEFQDRKELH